jgi:hypothetical protein
MMMILVTRALNFSRPGTPITFEVQPSVYPQILPHDVRDHIVLMGAGRLVPSQPGQRDGGIAACIARKYHKHPKRS